MRKDLFIKNLILFPKNTFKYFLIYSLIILIKIKFNIYKIIIKLIYKYPYF